MRLPELNEDELQDDIEEQRPTAAPAPRRIRRRLNLIVDTRTELTDDEIRKNLDNHGDTCVCRQVQPALKKVPNVRELMAPVRADLSLGKQLFDPLFEGAIEAARENIENGAREVDVEPTDERPESAAEIARRRSSAFPHLDPNQLSEAPPMFQPDFQMDVAPIDLEPLPVVEPNLDVSAGHAVPSVAGVQSESVRTRADLRRGFQRRSCTDSESVRNVGNQPVSLAKRHLDFGCHRQCFARVSVFDAY